MQFGGPFSPTHPTPPGQWPRQAAFNRRRVLFCRQSGIVHCFIGNYVRESTSCILLQEAGRHTRRPGHRSQTSQITARGKENSTSIGSTGSYQPIQDHTGVADRVSPCACHARVSAPCTASPEAPVWRHQRRGWAEPSLLSRQQGTCCARSSTCCGGPCRSPGRCSATAGTAAAGRGRGYQGIQRRQRRGHHAAQLPAAHRAAGAAEAHRDRLHAA
jgi:hypothetical protein